MGEVPKVLSVPSVGMLPLTSDSDFCLLLGSFYLPLPSLVLILVRPDCGRETTIVFCGPSNLDYSFIDFRR
jgi:hypothetical protein